MGQESEHSLAESSALVSKAAVQVLARTPVTSGGPMGEVSTSRLTQAVGAGDFLVAWWPKALVCASCGMKPSLGS